MANKCLRRCLRSGLILFFTHHHGHPAAKSSRTKLMSSCKQLHNMQELYPHHHHTTNAACMPTSCNVRAMPASSASCSACLPLPQLAAARSCLPQLASYSPTSSTPRFIRTAADDDDINHLHNDHLQVDNLQLQQNDINDLLTSTSDGELRKLKARSHSCSKLQCDRLDMMPSPMRSTLHRSHSHGRLHSHSQILEYVEHADELERGNVSRSSRSALSSSALGVGEYYTRSGSFSRLRKMKKAGSFHDLQEGGHSSSRWKGKRAPKGHVAVYVEEGKDRHVVPIGYLSDPQFQALLERAESEFGFEQKGGLLLPCSRAELLQTLHSIRARHQSHPSIALAH